MTTKNASRYEVSSFGGKPCQRRVKATSFLPWSALSPPPKVGKPLEHGAPGPKHSEVRPVPPAPMWRPVPGPHRTFAAGVDTKAPASFCNKLFSVPPARKETLLIKPSCVFRTACSCPRPQDGSGEGAPEGGQRLLNLEFLCVLGGQAGSFYLPIPLLRVPTPTAATRSASQHLKHINQLHVAKHSLHQKRAIPG